MKNHIVSFFPDTDLRCGHAGLTNLALSAKRNPSALKPGQFLVFVNRQQTAIKILATSDMLAHYKSPSGRVNLTAVTLLPKYFNGGSFNYSAALKATILRTLKKVNVV